MKNLKVIVAFVSLLFLFTGCSRQYSHMTGFQFNKKSKAKPFVYRSNSKQRKKQVHLYNKSVSSPEINTVKAKSLTHVTPKTAPVEPTSKVNYSAPSTTKVKTIHAPAYEKKSQHKNAMRITKSVAASAFKAHKIQKRIKKQLKPLKKNDKGILYILVVVLLVLLIVSILADILGKLWPLIATVLLVLLVLWLLGML